MLEEKRIKAEERKKRNPDNDNDDTLHFESVFDDKYMRREEKEDLQTTNLKYLNWVLSQIRPSDLFGDNFVTQGKRLSDEAARNLLQSDECLKSFAWVQASLDPKHELNGKIRQKLSEISSIAKALFKDIEIWKNWKEDINRRKQKFRNRVHGSDNYTPSTIPDGYWFSNSNKGSPITSYAVSSARNVEVSCNRLPAKIFYDPFDATFRVEYDGELKIMNSARQVRSLLLVPIANKFGYEAHRDHFDDFIEALKSDEGRHRDSLIHYYNAWESHYDPDFKCIDECVSIPITMTTLGRVLGHSSLATCSAPIFQGANCKESYH